MTDKGQAAARSRAVCVKTHVLPMLVYVLCGSRANGPMVAARLLPMAGLQIGLKGDRMPVLSSPLVMFAS